MKEKTKYTQHQISESICYWSRKLLDEGLATEDELRDLIGEGLFRRAIGTVKRGVEGVKNAATAIKEAPKKLFDRVFKPNAGVVKMRDAINKMSKDGIELKGVKIYATLGKSTFPVVDFLLKGKKSLMLVIDKAVSSAKPKTLAELREFLHDHLPTKAKVVDAIDGIYCAEANKEVLKALFESKLTDYIEKKGLSKEDALKPETVKEIKRLKIMKKKDEDIKAAIEKHFSQSKEEPSGKKPKASHRAEAKAKEPETKDEPSSKPMEKDPPKEGASKKPEKPEKPKKPQLTIFDNQLLDVKSQKDNLGFIFSKSKAEIKLDKEYEHMFSE